jgi:hypothetical protein
MTRPNHFQGRNDLPDMVTIQKQPIIKMKRFTIKEIEKLFWEYVKDGWHGKESKFGIEYVDFPKWLKQRFK